MENNKNCDSCNHLRAPKVIDRWNIDSPCYTCVFNIHMKKTNNYSNEASNANIVMFPFINDR